MTIPNLIPLTKLDHAYTMTVPSNPKASRNAGKQVELPSKLPAALKNAEIESWSVFRFAPGQTPDSLNGMKMRYCSRLSQAKRLRRSAGVPSAGGISTSSSGDLTDFVLPPPTAGMTVELCPASPNGASSSSSNPNVGNASDSNANAKVSLSVHNDLADNYLVFLPKSSSDSTKKTDSSASSKQLVPIPASHFVQVARHMLPWGSKSGHEFYRDQLPPLQEPEREAMTSVEDVDSIEVETSGAEKNKKTKKRNREDGNTTTSINGASSSNTTTSINGNNGNDSNHGIEPDSEWMQIRVISPGERYENVLPLARLLCPITCDEKFQASVDFRRVDVDSGAQRKLVGTWSTSAIRYESSLGTADLYNDILNADRASMFVGAFVRGKNPDSPCELLLFPTEHHGLRAAISEQELLLRTVTTNFQTMDTQEKMDRRGDFEQKFSATKRLRKLKSITITTPIGGRNFGSYPSPSSSSLLLPPSDAKNKEVTDERMEGNLADIQASLQTAAEEMDTARAAEGDVKSIALKKYLPAWNDKPTPGDARSIFGPGLAKAFPKNRIVSDIFLTKQNALLKELWDNRSSTTDSKLKEACGNCRTVHEFITKKRNLGSGSAGAGGADAGEWSGKSGAEQMVKYAALVRVMLEMYKNRAFEKPGSRSFIMSKFRLFELFEFGMDAANSRKGQGKKGKDGKSSAAPSGKGEFTLERNMCNLLINNFYDCTVVASQVDEREKENKIEQCVLNKEKLLMHLILFLLHQSPTGQFNYANLEEDLGIQQKHSLRPKFAYLQCDLASYPQTTVSLGKKFDPNLSVEDTKGKAGGAKGGKGGGKRGKGGKGKGKGGN